MWPFCACILVTRLVSGQSTLFASWSMLCMRNIAARNRALQPCHVFWCVWTTLLPLGGSAPNAKFRTSLPMPCSCTPVSLVQLPKYAIEPLQDKTFWQHGVPCLRVRAAPLCGMLAKLTCFLLLAVTSLLLLPASLPLWCLPLLFCNVPGCRKTLQLFGAPCRLLLMCLLMMKYPLSTLWVLCGSVASQFLRTPLLLVCWAF